MIKPTIGRVVWYWPGGKPENPGSQPNAAIITHVFTDTNVNLSVFAANGTQYGEIGIELWQGEGQRPASGHCEWMPYQKALAEREDNAALGLSYRNPIKD